MADICSDLAKVHRPSQLQCDESEMNHSLTMSISRNIILTNILTISPIHPKIHLENDRL